MSAELLGQWADYLGPIAGVHPALIRAVAALESGRTYTPATKSQFGIKGAFGPATSAAVRKFFATRGADMPWLEVDRDWTITSGTREQRPDGTVYRITADFRGYPTVAHATADFARMLADRNPYKRQGVSSVYDPEVQAIQTWAAGYATSLTWPRKIVGLIRQEGFLSPYRAAVDRVLEAAAQNPAGVREALRVK